MLEPRWVLSVAPTTVGIGAPVLVAFEDPTAAAGTTYTAHSDNTALTATVLKTTEMLKMQVHFVGADGSTVSGEMDFLLLDDYAPNNIAHITTLVNQGFYNNGSFHRIIEDFMDQGGDPLGTGSGGSGTNGAEGDTQDDEFDVDLRFTSSGILALANHGADTNDCQFFVMNDAYRSLDYGYTIIGKLVAGDDIRQALAAVPVENNDSGEASKPVNPVTIDSVSIVTDVQYGVLMLKSAADATAGQTANVTVTASDGSAVLIMASDGSTQTSVSTSLTSDTPSTNDRPAFIEDTMPDIRMATTGPTAHPVSWDVVPIPVQEGDAGVALAYDAVVSDSTNITVSASGTNATDGVATIQVNNSVVGVYTVLVGVRRDSSTSGSTNFDTQCVALFVAPTTPTSLSVTTADVTNGCTTAISNGLTFHVTGVTSGMTVGIFADDGSTPIGTAVATGDTIDIQTTVAVTDGQHTFTVKQYKHYDDTPIGITFNEGTSNEVKYGYTRTVAAGELYSDASESTVTFTVDTQPKAKSELANVGISGNEATFKVTYNTPVTAATMTRSTIDDNDIVVTGPNGFSQHATLVSVLPDSDAQSFVATYRITTSAETFDLGMYTVSLQ
ncbi:MAG: peptidylprolyl isomerase, partial [Thermoguttaceae bacterium]